MCAFAPVWRPAKVRIFYTDDRENTRPVEHQIVNVDETGLPNFAAIMTAAKELAEVHDDCSEAAVERYSVTFTAADTTMDTLPAINEGPRELGTVENKVAMDFQLADGRIVREYLRAPKNNPTLGANLFSDDGRTIDEQDTNVAAFIAKVISKVTYPGLGEAAVAVAEFVGGYLIPGSYIEPRKGTEIEHED